MTLYSFNMPDSSKRTPGPKRILEPVAEYSIRLDEIPDLDYVSTAVERIFPPHFAPGYEPWKIVVPGEYYLAAYRTEEIKPSDLSFNLRVKSKRLIVKDFAGEITPRMVIELKKELSGSSPI